MKALCWHGTNDIRCDNVLDPKIEDGRDVIIKVTSCAICGSDLHLMDGLMPTMKSGDILGHEFMGEVIETGSSLFDVQCVTLTTPNTRLAKSSVFSYLPARH
jgi:threonine dehydrogenase-like Zn-dependent dehydrogenase